MRWKDRQPYSGLQQMILMAKRRANVMIHMPSPNQMTICLKVKN